jgi:diadenosine tetraphosphate (Ap4A) HIT family hydrolase
MALLKKLFLFIGLSSSLIACPFCSEEVIERQKVYESPEALAILTYKPAAPGHMLIIPKRHVERFEGLQASEIAEMMEMIHKVDSAAKKIYGTSGSFIMEKNGPEAGQSVPHVHFHYIPCHEGGSAALLALKILTADLFSPLTEEEMKTIASAFQTQF